VEVSSDMAPLLSRLGYSRGGFGFGERKIVAPAIPLPLPYGNISGTWSGNDGYSGGYLYSNACSGSQTFDARPPTNAQVTQLATAWTTCKGYESDTSIIADATTIGLFFSRSTNSFTLNFSNWPGGIEMANFILTDSTRNWTVSGTYSATYSNTGNSYVYWTMPANGSATLTVTTTTTGDPPYWYWSGARYQQYQ